MAVRCVFCRIAMRELPAKFVFEDPEVMAFPDLNPQAPVHILIVPKMHFTSVLDAGVPHMGLLGKLILVAKDLAIKYKCQDGFRLVFNSGPRAGQEVPHIHLHLLSGREMNWPPG